MTISDQFRHVDTKKSPGVYVTFKREEVPDEFGHSYLADIGEGDETDEHRQQTAARVRAYDDGEWSYIGIRAAAYITHVHASGYSTTYAIKSAGLWGIESDSGEDYLAEVFEEQKQELRDFLAALRGKVIEG